MTLNQIIDHFGSAAKAARALNISRASVSAWKNKVPEMSQYKVYYVTKRKLDIDEEYKNE